MELMAPAGSFESLRAAIKAGCDSVYFGVTQLNMRARSSINFSMEDMKEIVAICHESTVKAYMTVNTLLYNHDLKLAYKLIDAAKKAGMDAVIVSDVAAMIYANEIGVPVHMSTQLSISNIEGIKFYAKHAERIVLARELNLAQIKELTEKIKEENIKGAGGKLMEIEVFGHGAMCVAVSGRCYMSLYTDNASANRGVCVQNCRRKYKVTDVETGQVLVLDNEYIMSPEDQCTIDFLDKISFAGVHTLKIEGRGRNPDYVYTAIKAYREALDALEDGSYTEEKIKKWKEQLGRVYNRGLSDGYFMSRKIGRWAADRGNKSPYEKIFIGTITHYYPKSKAAVLQVETGSVAVGEDIVITGTTTGVVKGKIKEIRKEDIAIQKAKKGELISFPVDELVRKNDKFFVVRKRDDMGKKI